MKINQITITPTHITPTDDYPKVGNYYLINDISRVVTLRERLYTTLTPHIQYQIVDVMSGNVIGVSDDIITVFDGYNSVTVLKLEHLILEEL